MTHHSSSERLLRRTLTFNAVFSGLSGLTCMEAAAAIANFSGLPQREIFAIGIDLAVFAVFLVFLSRRPELTRGWPRVAVPVVIALDVLWVFGSATALMTPGLLTSGGKWAVGLAALAVADFAFFQFRGWRGMSETREPVAAALG